MIEKSDTMHIPKMCPCGCGSEEWVNYPYNHTRFLEVVACSEDWAKDQYNHKELIAKHIWHMHAKYNTACSICSEKIPVGCQIIRVPDEADTENQEYKFVWIHMKCFINALEKHYACLDEEVQQALVDEQHDNDDKWYSEYGEGTHGFGTCEDLKEDLECQEDGHYGGRHAGTEFLYNVAYHWINPDMSLPIGTWAAMNEICVCQYASDAGRDTY